MSWNTAVADCDSELRMLLPPVPRHWDYRCVYQGQHTVLFLSSKQNHPLLYFLKPIIKLI